MSAEGRLNERRLAGLLLAMGAVIFLTAAGLPLWDGNMKSVYMMPMPERFTFILGNAVLWGWACALFIAGALIALCGLVLLTGLLSDAGERIYSRLSLFTLAVGVILWTVEMGFRMSVGGWARTDGTNSTVLDLFLRLSGWVQVLFMVNTVLMLVGTAAYGVALLVTHFLPRWIGWLAVVVGLLGLVALLAFGDVPPFVIYIPILLVGIRLLIPLPARATSKTDGKSEPQATLQQA